MILENPLVQKGACVIESNISLRKFNRARVFYHISDSTFVFVSAFLLALQASSAGAAGFANNLVPSRSEQGRPAFVELDEQIGHFRLAPSSPGEPEGRAPALREPQIAGQQSTNLSSGGMEEWPGPLTRTPVLGHDVPGGGAGQPLPTPQAYAVSKRKVEWRDIRKFEIAFQVLNIVDAVETISCLERNRCREMNPLLGHNPSAGKIIAVKAGSGVLHYMITRYLWKNHPSMVDEWAISTTVLQGGVVLWNLQHCF